MREKFRLFNCLVTPGSRFCVRSNIVFIEHVHGYLHKLSGCAAMQEQYLMIIIEVHQFPYKYSCFIHYFLEQCSAMANFKDRQTGIIKIKNSLARLFKNFFRKNRRA